MVFEIHPDLATGAFEIGRFGGCMVLLKNTAIFPWFLVVPEVEGIEDLHELLPGRYEEVMAAVRRISEFVADYFQPDKLNVACIGNQVRQMHIHVVARSPEDPAWPGTVWAFEGKKDYNAEENEKIRAAARVFLGLS